jgi:hypothetical protein
MGVILGLTMLGLVYLTQTLGANAMSAQIDELRAEQAKQVRTLTNQQAAIQLKADPAKVALRAGRADLKRLGDAIVLRAP